MAAVVHHLPAARKRGRPPKGHLLKTPCTRPFSDVAGEIVELAKDKKLWAKAKAEARAQASKDRKRLGPVARDLIGFLVDNINRDKGMDWRSVETLSKAIEAPSKRTVERAITELRDAGYILRDYEIKDVRHASRFGKTTIPALLDAAARIQGDETTNDPPNNSGTTRQENTNDPPLNDERPANKMQERPAKNGGVTLKHLNPLRNPLTQPGRSGEREVASLLEVIRRPNREAILDTLISPLIRQRTLIDAPDPGFTLGNIADRYAEVDSGILASALRRLLSEREAKVKPKDISKAIDKEVDHARLVAENEERQRRMAERQREQKAILDRVEAAQTIDELDAIQAEGAPLFDGYELIWRTHDMRERLKAKGAAHG